MTEVIESCFGRLKLIKGDQQQRSVSSMLLSLERWSEPRQLSRLPKPSTELL